MPLGHPFRMDRMREIRKSRGLSQEQLAEKAGVNQATISKIERGDGNPTLEMINALAAALDVETADLFTRSDLKGRAALAVGQLPADQREAAVVVLEAMVPRRGKKEEG